MRQARTPCALRCFIVLLLLSVTACSGTRPIAPVADRTTALRGASEEYREIVRGDTLYSIAWEIGRDYKEVAAWNDIAPPYLLYPGQKLRLREPAKKEIQTQTAAAKKQPNLRVVKKAPPASNPKVGASKPAAPSKSRGMTRAMGGWLWPTTGTILSRYSASGANKGIDIAGPRGQTIKAASAGKVVYIGSGLRGYGQLIILKHNEEFLSAYAHNDKIYVTEGDVVKAGQQIAEMGSSGADRVKLHFEIRRRGVPVDPLLYLPKN